MTGRRDGGMDDLISRQDAINAMATWEWQELYLPIHFKQLLEDLPSAQPETHDKRMETHGVCLDTIDRQLAIDALTRKMVSIPTAGEKDLMGDVNRIRAEDISVIRRLPSTQPEIIRCKNCKYNSNTCGNYVNCDIIPQMFGRTTDNFCSIAERRTDE